MNTTYKPNIIPPNILVIFHLLSAMVTTTATNIKNNRMVEQKSPEFCTTTSLKLLDILYANQGNGNLKKKVCMDELPSKVVEKKVDFKHKWRRKNYSRK